MGAEHGASNLAVLSHGGFLGIGDVLIPIPFDALMTGDEKGTVVLDIDKQTLEKALSFESKTWPDFTAAEWNEKIDRYFAAYAAGSSQPQPLIGVFRVISARSAEMTASQLTKPEPNFLGRTGTS